jgi:hypothetical protein
MLAHTALIYGCSSIFHNIDRILNSGLEGFTCYCPVLRAISKHVEGQKMFVIALNFLASTHAMRISDNTLHLAY